MNVVVLLADSWRYDHFGFTGNDWIKTPNMDAFARESFVFNQAYSGGLPTLPQRTECFTGRHMLKTRAWGPLEPDDQVIAEATWGNGVESAIISDCWHLNEPRMGYGRAFDTARFIRGQEEDPAICDMSIKVDPLAHFKLRDADKADAFASTNEHFKKQAEIYERNRTLFEKEEDFFCPRVVNEALDWLEKRKGRDDLFLWVDSFDPHEPWDPPAPYDRMYQPEFAGKDLWLQVPGGLDGYLDDAELNNIRALYAGMCTMVDKWFGIFLDRMKEWGFWENTLFVFLSDHGEFLGHGKWGHGQIRKACVWPYEELAHVPLIVHHPDGAGSGRHTDAMVQPCDLAPTILEALGIDGLPDRHGESILPIVRGEKDSIRDFSVAGKHGRNWCIRDAQYTYMLFFGNKWGDWLLDVETGAPKETSPPELYDRIADPYELNNIIDQHPDEAARLDKKLRDFMESLS